MTRRHTAYALLLAAILATGCRREGNAPVETHLTLLYTTDIHGAILPYDFNHDRPSTVSMAHASSYIAQARSENPDGTILLDGGDMTQGNPAMYYFNYIAMRSTHLAARAANYMGYDAGVLGNHDIEAGEHVYFDRLPRQMDMPLLAANAIHPDTREPAFAPYTVVERHGLRIAIVGFITPDVHKWTPKSVWPNLEFRDIIETAEEWIPRIKLEERPDLIVGVFHAGSELYTVNEYNQPRTRIDGVIPTLMQVRGFDIALLGHDHESLATYVVNNYGDTIPTLESSAHMEEIARADIYVKRDSEGFLHKRILMSRIEVDGLPLDDAFMEEMGGDIARVNDFLDTPLGTVTETLHGAASLVGPSNLMDLIHEIQLSVTEADISFASALSTFHDIKAGPLTMRQIFSMYRYENHIHKVWMKGHDVKVFLEHGYARQFNRMFSAGDHLLGFKFKPDGTIPIGSFGPELRTPQYNYTSAAGIYYDVDVSRPAGNRVRIYAMADGTPFDSDKIYHVAINSYQASGGGGFVTEGLGWGPDDIAYHTINESTKDMCYYISDYIARRGTITPPSRRHWHVEPLDWWHDAASRDTALMLPYILHRTTVGNK